MDSRSFCVRARPDGWGAARHPAATCSRFFPTRKQLGTAFAALLLSSVLALTAAAKDLAPADALLTALAGEEAQRLIEEVLERNPEIARARHRAVAAAVRAPQVKALPDPVASLSLFVLPPETRAGPQRLSATFSQRLPWFGKLDLAEQAALLAAQRARSEVETQRLRLVTETRRLLSELAFLADDTRIVSEEREHLVRHEEVARARYSAGMGLQQEVLKIQADITRTENRLLEIQARQRSVEAALNRLRNQPASREIAVPELLPFAVAIPTHDELRQQALANRPEIGGQRAEIARREIGVELAGKDFYPDLNLGLGYTVVDRRQDRVGRLDPPADDGDDILALSLSARLPVRKRKLEAALEEAMAHQAAAEEGLRHILAEIDSKIGDTAARLPLLAKQRELLEGVLLAQAEEALRSSEAAYTTGKLNALDLLDAEHILFQVRTAAARVRADYAIAVAELEGLIGGPLPVSMQEETP